MSNIVYHLPKAWVVTTVFNRFDALRRYLDCLSQQDYDNFCLVLIDHGPQNVTDNVALPGYVILLKSTPDKWWTSAVNIGVNYVLNQVDVQDTDFLILQNDDSTFGPSFLMV